MSKLKVKINIDSKAILILKKAQQKALIATADQIITDVQQSQVVPAETRTLERSVAVKQGLINKGKIEISFNTPYARRLYFHPEYNFSKEINKNAKGKWLEWYMQPEGQKWIKEVYAKMYKMESGL